MGRSNGRFPSYEKLDLDPTRWPARYHDSSRFCTECEFLWPDLEIFDPTPCCGARGVKNIDLAPEIRWDEAVRRLLEARFNEIYEEYNEGVTDDQLILDEVMTNGYFDKAQGQVEHFVEDATVKI